MDAIMYLEKDNREDYKGGVRIRRRETGLWERVGDPGSLVKKPGKTITANDELALAA